MKRRLEEEKRDGLFMEIPDLRSVNERVAEEVHVPKGCQKQSLKMLNKEMELLENE